MRDAVDPMVARLAVLDSCIVADALDSIGRAGVLGGIVPMWEGAKVAGRVTTIQLVPGGSAPGDEPVHLGARAIDTSERGSVMVVANDGRLEMGGWGGLLSLAATVRGLAGAIVDGACRDIDEGRGLGFPLFARAPVARTARGRVHEQSTGEPVHIAGITVRTGDLVVGDGSGVVVVSAAQELEVIERAEALLRRESLMAEQLRSGRSARSVLGRSYEKLLDDVR